MLLVDVEMWIYSDCAVIGILADDHIPAGVAHQLAALRHGEGITTRFDHNIRTSTSCGLPDRAKSFRTRSVRYIHSPIRPKLAGRLETEFRRADDADPAGPAQKRQCAGA